MRESRFMGTGNCLPYQLLLIHSPYQAQFEEIIFSSNIYSYQEGKSLNLTLEIPSLSPTNIRLKPCHLMLYERERFEKRLRYLWIMKQITVCRLSNQRLSLAYLDKKISIDTCGYRGEPKREAKNISDLPVSGVIYCQLV